MRLEGKVGQKTKGLYNTAKRTGFILSLTEACEGFLTEVTQRTLPLTTWSSLRREGIGICTGTMMGLPTV
jgi:hypothetical protein